VTLESQFGGIYLLGSFTVNVTSGPPNGLVALRFDQLALREPHVFGPSCVDFTDNLNALIQSGISTDGDITDGYFGMNEVLVFPSLDPNAATTTAYLSATRCAIASTPFCFPDDPGTALTLTNQPSGTCLGIIAGTTSGYSPPIGTTAGNCFASAPVAIPLMIGGTPVQLLDAQLAAVYNGTRLESGLLRGFLRESDAEAAMIHSGSTSASLASMLPGGTNGCGTDGRDMLNGEVGWWFYFNFTATKVFYAP